MVFIVSNISNLRAGLARSAEARTAWRLVRLLLLTSIILLPAACNRQSDSQLGTIAGTPTVDAGQVNAEPVQNEPDLGTATGVAQAGVAQADATPSIPLEELLAATVPMTQTAPLNNGDVLSETSPLSADAGAPPTAPSNDSILQPTATPTPPTLGRVTATLVNVRGAASLNAPVLGTLADGEQVTILGISPDTDWVQICCLPIPTLDDATPTAGGVEQWVSAEFLDFAPLPPTPTAATADDARNANEAVDAASAAPTVVPDGVTVAADLVNLRGGPGTTYGIVGQARAGTTFQVLGRNETSDWVRVCCPLGETTDEPESWVSVALLTNATLVGDAPVLDAPPTPVVVVAPVGAPAAPGDQAAALAAAPAPGLPGDGGFGAPGGSNPLTGQAWSGAAVRPVIVCINNDYAARPQYGISQADVMYEYLMEGFGITRFSGVFLGESPAQIGPVRSARLVNYYLGALYNGGLACSGASDQVRYTLKFEAPFPYLDIDLDDASNIRYSDSVGTDYRTRLRTSFARLMQWLVDWGAQQPASVRGFTFGDPAGGGAPASAITIPYPSGTGSQVAYVYDAGSGRYLRSLGGSAHLDGNSGAQVGVENVVVQYIPHQVTDIVEDSLGSLGLRLNLFGSGRALIFRDGVAYEGTWRSESRGDLPRFYTADGAEIPLKPGHSWFSLVPLDYGIGYQ